MQSASTGPANYQPTTQRMRARGSLSWTAVIALLTLPVVHGCGPLEPGEQGLALEEVGSSHSALLHGYQVYFGNTHSHSSFSDGQATPADHFARAKFYGYDFYVMSDHGLAKYAGYTAANWKKTGQQATAATTTDFVAIRGYEHSENGGPKGHLNVFHPGSTLDASAAGVDLPTFYDWLVEKDAVASFNHPKYDNEYHFNNFAYLNTKRRAQITMIETLKRGYNYLPGTIGALDKGWRVAPCAAHDNHSFTSNRASGPIATNPVRTAVLARSLSRWNILQAMRARRVYATSDKNLQLSYTVNGVIMGSVLKGPRYLRFAILAKDPNTSVAADKITKIEILGEGGKVVRANASFDAHEVNWTTTVTKVTQKYYWVRVFTRGATDATAYLAPVWIEACTSAAQCNDGNACTQDSCQAGVCQPKAIANCCTQDAQCDDGNPCTTNTCQNNACKQSTIANCCTQDAQCDDGNACTEDRCEDNACAHDLLPLAECCDTDDQCDDEEACTTDTCIDNACQHIRKEGCGRSADSGVLPEVEPRQEESPRPASALLSGGCHVASPNQSPIPWPLLTLALLFQGRGRSRRSRTLPRN